MRLPFGGTFTTVLGLEWLCQLVSALKYLQSGKPIIVHRDM